MLYSTLRLRQQLEAWTVAEPFWAGDVKYIRRFVAIIGAYLEADTWAETWRLIVEVVRAGEADDGRRLEYVEGGGDVLDAPAPYAA